MRTIIKIAALSGLCVVMASSFAMAEKKGNRDGGLSKRFEKIDANADGSLTVDEFIGAASKRFDKADLNSDGILSEGELVARIARKQAKRRAARLINRLDYNGDGKVTKDEIQNRTRKRFALLDGNDDGKVEKSEMKRHASRSGKARQMRKHRRTGKKMHQKNKKHQ